MGLERHGKRIWVNSHGGPLIALEARLLPSWRGIDDGDYERACAIQGWFGTLPVADGAALVLGDEPLMTTVVLRPDGLLFVRWHAAEDVDPVDRLLDDLACSAFTTTEHPTQSIAFADSSVVLFDSTETGASQSVFALAPPRAIGEGAIRFPISPGIFFLRHRLLQASAGDFSVVQLVRAGQP